MAVGLNTGIIQLYDDGFNLINTFQAHTSAVIRIRQLPNGYVGTCGDLTVKLWDPTNNWSLIATYTGHTLSLFDLAYINTTLMSSATRGQVHIWSTITLTAVRIITTSSDGLSLLYNGYLAGGNTYNLNIWDINTGNVISTLTGHTLLPSDIKSNGALILASAGDDQKVIIWDLATYTLKYTLTGHTSNVEGLVFITPNILASASYDMTIKLWDVTNGILIRTLTGHTSVIQYAIDAFNSSILITGSNDQTVKVWDVNTGVVLMTVATGTPVECLGVIGNYGSRLKYISELDKVKAEIT